MEIATKGADMTLTKTRADRIRVGDTLDTNTGPATVESIDAGDFFTRNAYSFLIRVEGRDAIRVGAFAPSFKLNVISK